LGFLRVSNAERHARSLLGMLPTPEMVAVPAGAMDLETAETLSCESIGNCLKNRRTAPLNRGKKLRSKNLSTHNA
jgi:hypothetical protein